MRSNTDLIVLPEAEDDIRDIFKYTREVWGNTQADAYVDLIDSAFRRIQTFPEIGMVADETRPNLREYQLEHHLILYRREPNAVTILRVINPRRLRR